MNCCFSLHERNARECCSSHSRCATVCPWLRRRPAAATASAVREGDLLWTPPPERRGADAPGRVHPLRGGPHRPVSVRLRRALDVVGHRARGVLAGGLGLLRGPVVGPAQPPSSESREMPGARWFPGARLNFAEHVLRQERPGPPALLFVGETTPLHELPWEEFAAAGARRRHAPADAGRPAAATGSSPTCPTSRGHGGDGRDGQRRRDLGQLLTRLRRRAARWTGSASWSRRSSSPPTATATAAGTSTAAARSPSSWPGCRACARSCTCPVLGLDAARHAVGRRAGRSAAPRPPSSSASRCPSTIRCGCCSPPAPPACPRRSCTATAGSCSSS